MVTSFNRKDLVSFGNYLLSDARREMFVEGEHKLSLEERLCMVHHADVCNWLDIQEKTFVENDNERYFLTNTSGVLKSNVKFDFATQKDLDNFFSLIIDKEKLVYDEIDKLRKEMTLEIRCQMATEKLPSIDV